MPRFYYIQSALYTWARWMQIGWYGSMFCLGCIFLSFIGMIVVSLIPLYVDQYAVANGEVYCINNYNMIADFQIPIYTTNLTLTTNTTPLEYTFDSGRLFINSSCTNNTQITQQVKVTERCDIHVQSIMFPLANGRILNNYALSDACYRRLQSCHSDSELTACLLSDCTVVDTNVNYTISCKANIYYHTRCTDAPVNSRLYYSSAQQNSACRQLRLNRINSCLNSTAELSNVPCMISVSNGTVLRDATNASCTQNAIITSGTLTLYDFSNRSDGIANLPSINAQPANLNLTELFSNEIFSASDQTIGHPFRINSVKSTVYSSNQSGALYCGGITRPGIISAIANLMNSQSSLTR